MPLWPLGIRDHLQGIRRESGVFAWVFLALVAILFLIGIAWFLLGI